VSRPLVRLSRTAPAPPVRVVHLGLGSFFRAHQAWYTQHAPDAAGWGIAAFSGRSAALAEALAAQDGLYTLVTRAADGDRFEVVGSVVAAHPAADQEAWLGHLSSPEVAVVTLTVTEAGYRPGPGSAVQRLVAGLAARRVADAGPLTLLPCDNVADNGAVLARAVTGLVERTDSALLEWLASSVSFATTMVDRITPRTTDDDARAVAAATGLDDAVPVVTEPFSEWVVSGAFPAGRPSWEAAGARLTDDLAPFEQRKLWLLNGGHSLLAYAAPLRGAVTVADAVADPVVCRWLDAWWGEASGHLPQPASELAGYRDALLERFANPRMRHRLAQIAADGSQKLPVRVLPVVRAERAARRLPEGAVVALAAWVCHLRGADPPVDDVRADEMVPVAQGPLAEAVRRVLAALDPEAGADLELVTAVAAVAKELCPS
jgi:fructuronate reductase